MNNKVTMPLLSFNVATENVDGSSIANGMNEDGTFTLSHTFTQTPPPETEYTLKHVFFISSGIQSEGAAIRWHQPAIWCDIAFPQLDREIVSVNSSRVKEFRGKNHVVNSGVIRFPVTTFPVTGEKNNDVDSNEPRRARTLTLDNFAQHFRHQATHICNLPLGSMRLSENRIECIIRPIARQDLQAVDADEPNNELFPAIRAVQLILEYK